MRKFKSDEGNATAILGILLIMVLLVVGGMMLDITKAFQLKSAYVDSVRKATQAGIMHQNSQGFLTADAAAEAIRVYETIARPSVIKDGYMSYCNDDPNAPNKRNVEIAVYFMKGGEGNGYSTGFKRDPNADKIIVNSADIKEGDSLSTILDKAGLRTNSQRKNIENRRYKGLQMEIYEATPNVILPSAQKIAGTNNGWNFKCQVLGIKEGASQFIGETDIYH